MKVTGLAAAAVASALLVLPFLAQHIAAEDNSGSNYGSYSTVYGTNYYADTQQTYYDGYAQAWRYLGWYVDCNGGSSRYYEKSHHSGSGDSYKVGNNYCQRYLMWAAVSVCLKMCTFGCDNVLRGELILLCSSFHFVV
jgi:hypothetical protein